MKTTLAPCKSVLMLMASFVIFLSPLRSQPLVDLEPFASGLTRPVVITNGGDERLFVVEQPGKIRIVDPSGSLITEPFLDIQDRVSYGGEKGLLGLAFHPDYQSNGYFYVNYTDNAGDTRVSRFSVSDTNANTADDSSESLILWIDQPFSNHNGGDIKFGPDGYLYIATGDGGSGGDPLNSGQDTLSLLGKILRIDINVADTYAIPVTNPFAGESGPLDEIWAMGLRNPWRMSFDRLTGDLWIGDVGQGTWEEINFQDAGSSGGENYGWRCYEGNHPYNLGGCNGVYPYVWPVHEYNHSATSGCSVTGGFVYRGSRYPGIYGYYFYSDYCNDSLWSLHASEGEWIPGNHGFYNGYSISTFGEDAGGELFAAGLFNGNIYRVIDTAVVDTLCEVWDTSYTVPVLEISVEDSSFTLSDTSFSVSDSSYTVSDQIVSVSDTSFALGDSTFTIIDSSFYRVDTTFFISETLYEIVDTLFTVYDSVFIHIDSTWTITDSLCTAGQISYTATDTAVSVWDTVYMVPGSWYELSDTSYTLWDSSFSVRDSSWNILDTSAVFSGDTLCEVWDTSYTVSVLEISYEDSSFTLSDTSLSVSDSSYTVSNQFLSVSDTSFVVGDSTFTVIDSSFYRVDTSFFMSESLYEIVDTLFTVYDSVIIHIDSTWTITDSLCTAGQISYTATDTAVSVWDTVYMVPGSWYELSDTSYTLWDSSFSVRDSSWNILDTSAVFSGDTTTAVLNSMQLGKMRLYPVPVRDLLEIDAEWAIPGTATVMDLNGRIFLKTDIYENPVRIRTGKLEAGTYIVVVSGRDRKASGKFLKE